MLQSKLKYNWSSGLSEFCVGLRACTFRTCMKDACLGLDRTFYHQNYKCSLDPIYPYRFPPLSSFLENENEILTGIKGPRHCENILNSLGPIYMYLENKSMFIVIFAWKIVRKELLIPLLLILRFNSHKKGCFWGFFWTWNLSSLSMTFTI